MATHPNLLPRKTLLSKLESLSLPHPHRSILQCTLARASLGTASHVFLVVCCILHNFCRVLPINYDDDDDDNDDDGDEYDGYGESDETAEG